MTQDFDLIVIGGGSGGLAGAFRAAEHGARVALLEPALLGGTCVNLGCVPKKAMWLASDIAGKLRMAKSLGFGANPGDEAVPALDWPAFVASRQRYISNINDSYRNRLQKASIALLPVHGCLHDANTVQCANGVALTAPKMLLATGGFATKPNIPGAEFGVTSDDFFQWSAAPARVAIIGGGYIAVELAGLLQALGSRVDMFVRRPRLLDGFDYQLTEQLAEDYRQSGVHLHLNRATTALRRDNDGRLRVIDGEGQASDAFDQVLFATGRRANSASLGLRAADISTDERGHIQVDPFQATNVPGIYAVGDVTQQMQLTPVAIAAARRLMDRLFGGRENARVDLHDVPTVVFSHPPLARVGLTEAEARQHHGDDVHVYTSSFRPMLHALADSPQRSLFKLVCVGEERRVIGIHLLGDAADEILQGFAVALKRGITMADLRDTIAIHPTSAEEVVLMK